MRAMEEVQKQKALKVQIRVNKELFLLILINKNFNLEKKFIQNNKSRNFQQK